MAKYILRPPGGDKLSSEEFAYMLCDIIAGRQVHPTHDVHKRAFDITGTNDHFLRVTGDEAGVFSLSCRSPLRDGLRAYLAERFGLEGSDLKRADFIQDTIDAMIHQHDVFHGTPKP
jgi:hypothetical protein